MTVEVTGYIDVNAKATELGLNAPTGLAILPTHFESATSQDQLIDEELITTIRTLWRQAGISETKLKEEGFPQEIRRSLDITLPTLFIGISLLTQNPNLVTVAINVISNYLTDFFKGIPGNHTIKLDTIVQKNENEFSCVHYEGSKEGLSELPAIITAMYNERGKSNVVTSAANSGNRTKDSSTQGKLNDKGKNKSIRGKRKKRS